MERLLVRQTNVLLAKQVAPEECISVPLSHYISLQCTWYPVICIEDWPWINWPWIKTFCEYQQGYLSSTPSTLQSNSSVLYIGPDKCAVNLKTFLSLLLLLFPYDPMLISLGNFLCCIGLSNSLSFLWHYKLCDGQISLWFTIIPQCSGTCWMSELRFTSISNITTSPSLSPLFPPSPQWPLLQTSPLP